MKKTSLKSNSQPKSHLKCSTTCRNTTKRWDLLWKQETDSVSPLMTCTLRLLFINASTCTYKSASLSSITTTPQLKLTAGWRTSSIKNLSSVTPRATSNTLSASPYLHAELTPSRRQLRIRLNLSRCLATRSPSPLKPSATKNSKTKFWGWFYSFTNAGHGLDLTLTFTK